MGKPAARITDLHVCPMVTPGVPPVPHVGGPITGPGIPTVLIGGIPAAVMGDLCTCVGPPDSIIIGSIGVLFGGKPAARMGDQCTHGGTIVGGMPTVLIGEFGSPSAGIPPETSMAMKEVIKKMNPEAAQKSEQIIVLKNAAQNATPFCAVCEAKKH